MGGTPYTMGGIGTYRACVAGREIVFCGNDVMSEVPGGRGFPKGAL